MTGIFITFRNRTQGGWRELSGFSRGRSRTCPRFSIRSARRQSADKSRMFEEIHVSTRCHSPSAPPPPLLPMVVAGMGNTASIVPVRTNEQSWLPAVGGSVRANEGRSKPCLHGLCSLARSFGEGKSLNPPNEKPPTTCSLSVRRLNRIKSPIGRSNPVLDQLRRMRRN